MHTGCIPLGISNFGFYGKVSTHLTEYSINSAVIALIAFVFSSTNSDWLKIKIVVIQEGKQNILKHFSGNDIVPVRSEMRPSEGSISWMLIQVHRVSVQSHRFAYISSTKLHFYACLSEVITMIFSSPLLCSGESDTNLCMFILHTSYFYHLSNKIQIKNILQDMHAN